VENPFGRRRHFPVEDVPKICNVKSQSTAADVLFQGQRRLKVDFDGALQGNPELGYFLTTTHDSNLVEGPRWEPLAELLRDAMEAPIAQLDGMVIPCTIKIGKRWGELKPVSCSFQT
jgi:hypothetical protein